MHPPVIIVDGQDVTVFNSVNEAEKTFEAADIRDGGYAVYDAKGHQLELKIMKEKRRILFGLLPSEVEVVRFAERAGAPSCEPELRKAMIDFLATRKASPEGLQGMKTSELIRSVADLQK